MFLRSTARKKDGKEHRYWSVVENRRVSGNGTVQWHLPYPGEINDSRQTASSLAIEVFDEGDQITKQLALFAEHRLTQGRLANLDGGPLSNVFRHLWFR
jgi:hypothetical protein